MKSTQRKRFFDIQLDILWAADLSCIIKDALTNIAQCPWQMLMVIRSGESSSLPSTKIASSSRTGELQKREFEICH